MPYKDKRKDREIKEAYKQNNPEKIKEQSRQYFKDNKDEIYFRWIFRTYGITREIYDELLAKQDYVCAICGKLNANGWRLVLDHDHDSGAIRGILCRKCNAVLGLANDSSEVLLSAALYLKEYNK